MAIQTIDLVPARVKVRAEREMLKHAEPIKVFSSFGMAKEQPLNTSDTVIFRRAMPIDADATYDAPDVTAANYLLQEGVTPAAQTITYEDVTAVLQEYGILLKLSSKAELTYEDDIPGDMTKLVGEHMATLEEMIVFNALRGSTNILHATGSTPGAVNNAVSLNLLRRAAREIEKAHGMRITSRLAPGPNFGTSSVHPAFLVFCHPDCESDIRNIPGFTSVVDYGSFKPVHEREIGAVEMFRFITTPYCKPWIDTGATTSTMVTTGGTKADVYPMFVIAEQAYGHVALKGQGAIDVVYLPAKQKNHANPLGRFGYVGAQFMKTALLLNQQWIVTLKVGATDLSN